MSNILVNETLLSAANEPAHESLLGFIRNTARLTGTKEGCASGDCGACTVILRNADGSEPININSCITPVGAAFNKQVITVEGVGTPTAMHPVQQAMVDKHGSQCGFCTPGFVMSLVAAQLRGEAQPQAQPETQSANADDPEAIKNAVESISGNLCRCTGYRPIIDAALAANVAQAGADANDQLPATGQAFELAATAQSTIYVRPPTLAALLNLLSKDGVTRALSNSQSAQDNRWLVAGATDAFLEVSQRYLDPSLVADLSDVQELQGISNNSGEIVIGAAVTHAQALNYFSAQDTRSTAIVAVLQRFGSPQVRSRGTVGGNIANASPIADWPPMLIALGAELTLVSTNNQQRRVPLDAFYLDYKRTQLADNELILSIHIPADANPGTLLAHKISKRFEDDISSVLAAIYITLDENRVAQCRIAYGGVAATPQRCTNTEAVLVGQSLTEQLIDSAVAALDQETNPISDVRASSNYRKSVALAVLRNLLSEKLAAAEGESQ